MANNPQVALDGLDLGFLRNGPGGWHTMACWHMHTRVRPVGGTAAARRVDGAVGWWVGKSEARWVGGWGGRVRGVTATGVAESEAGGRRRGCNSSHTIELSLNLELLSSLLTPPLSTPPPLSTRRGLEQQRHAMYMVYNFNNVTDPEILFPSLLGYMYMY